MSGPRLPRLIGTDMFVVEQVPPNLPQAARRLRVVARSLVVVIHSAAMKFKASSFPTQMLLLLLVSAEEARIYALLTICRIRRGDGYPPPDVLAGRVHGRGWRTHALRRSGERADPG